LGSLADALEAVKVGKGPQCSVGRLLPTLDKADRATLDAWLANQLPPHTAVERALRAEGHDIARGAIARHRRGECACAR
jgi:hypothetical protein